MALHNKNNVSKNSVKCFKRMSFVLQEITILGTRYSFFLMKEKVKNMAKTVPPMLFT